MTTDATERFVESARAVEATVTRVGADEAESELARAIEPPAVGVEPDIEGVSLAGLDVTIDPTGPELREAATGITGVELGIADYGSVVIRETTAGEETASLFADTQIAVLAASDIVPDVGTAMGTLGEWLRAGGDAVVATGPSATADMGGLVLGAHGPKTLHVVVVTDR